MLKIYNTLTQKKETFTPINDKKVGLYVCGMTVYDLCHIGHARVLVAFDVIVRYLRNQGYEVNYVRNITDIDDKIIQRAQENNESVHDLTSRMISEMHTDLAQLGILLPNHEPKATESIASMLTIIQALLDKGFAYQAENGDILYAVKKFKTYGELAHQSLEKLRHGARVAVGQSKHDPLDFVLWKQAKPNEPSWNAPWGKGRPGWHIECSAMSMQALGQHFDLHGGGLDLVFPHHQNEIAQSEAATNKTFVNTWMHVGFVQINQQKMSKSLRNFFTLREVLTEYSAEVIRYFLLSSHYRSPINYSQENLQIAHAALQRFYTALKGFDLIKEPESDAYLEAMQNYQQQFNKTMDDDFNTPEALAVLFNVARQINSMKEKNDEEACYLAYYLKKQAEVLGILQQNPEQFLQSSVKKIDTHKIEALIAARDQARAEKNWREADRLRDEIQALGISLKDTSKGTEWHSH